MITLKGETLFIDWLQKPVLHGRDFRHYFLLKLFFALKKGSENALTLIDVQKNECEHWKSHLTSSFQTQSTTVKLHSVIGN